MVHLEEVEDQDLTRQQPGPLEDNDDDEADYTDTGSSLSAVPLIEWVQSNIKPIPDSSLSSDDDIPSSSLAPSESALDRIYALKDMIPPSTRRSIATGLSNTYSALKSTALFSGKSLYVLSTGGLMVIVPYMMAMVEEQQYMEMEREQKAREVGSEIMSPGAQVGAVPGAGAKASL
ncbi:MAG: hypothetical protein Q9201_006570 [Fulgogasparrea decipioides]